MTNKPKQNVVSEDEQYEFSKTCFKQEWLNIKGVRRTDTALCTIGENEKYSHVTDVLGWRHHKDRHLGSSTERIWHCKTDSQKTKLGIDFELARSFLAQLDTNTRRLRQESSSLYNSL